MIVAAVAVDDDDLPAAVAGHLIGGFLEEFELQFRAVSHRAGFMPGFEDLAEVVFGKDDRVLLPGTVKRGVADIDQIRAQRQMRPVLLDDAKGQQACALGLLNRGGEIPGREFLPIHRERLCRGNCGDERQKVEFHGVCLTEQHYLTRNSRVPTGSRVTGNQAR